MGDLEPPQTDAAAQAEVIAAAESAAEHLDDFAATYELALGPESLAARTMALDALAEDAERFIAACTMISMPTDVLDYPLADSCQWAVED